MLTVGNELIMITIQLQVWSNYSSLTFEQVDSGPKDIEIKFTRGDHGDNDPFKEEDGTLAHAYYPSFGSDTHFNDAQIWSINSYQGSLNTSHKVIPVSSQEMYISGKYDHHECMVPWF